MRFEMKPAAIIRAVALGSSLLLAFGAHAAEKAISSKIGKEMGAAQKDIQAGKWDEALKNLDAAEAKGGITPFDKSKIYEFRAYACTKQKNYACALQANEQALGTGVYGPEDTSRTNRQIFVLAYMTNNFPKTIEYGKKVTDNGAAGSTDDFAIIGQVYYKQNDCKSASAYMDKAIAAARKAGEAPKEGFYQIKLQCAFNNNDTPGTIADLQDLVRLTNKKEYWNQLIRFMRQDEREDRNLLMLYRLMYNTDSMTKGTEYVEMAQLLLDAALPGEAQMVLEKAIAKNMIPDTDKERTNRILASAKQRADKDRQGIKQFESDAGKAKTGDVDVKLGEVYYGFGDYQNAAAAIARGIQKGGVKHLDEAYVYLGLANQQLKNPGEAKKAFEAMKGTPGTSDRIAKLWDVYADKNV
jgi:tetratricopeptide (TPR) repeat protein